MIVFRIVTAHKFRDLFCPSKDVGSLSKLKKYIAFRIMPCVCIKLLRMIVLIAMFRGAFFGKIVQQLPVFLGGKALILEQRETLIITVY